ncbi:MAG: 50S ribosomal protein L10 [bacterium]
MCQSLIRTEKEKQVDEIGEKLQRAKAAVFSDFCGLKVKNMEELRHRLREQKVEFKVFKNTLIRKAFKGQEGIDDFLRNPTALAFGYVDPAAVAKILITYAKDNPALKIKGGVVEGKVMNVAQITSLAELPPREVLLAKVVMGIQSPLRGFMNVLNGPLTQLVMVLKAIEEKKKSQ